MPAFDLPPGYEIEVSRGADEPVTAPVPPAKLPLMYGGLAVMVGGGAMIALAQGAADDVRKATTVEELVRARDKANRLYLAGALTGLSGAGLFTVGVLVDDGAGLTVTARF